MLMCPEECEILQRYIKRPETLVLGGKKKDSSPLHSISVTESQSLSVQHTIHLSHHVEGNGPLILETQF